MLNSNITTLVFDFDGTLVNTLEFFSEIFAIIAPEFGLKHLSQTELADFTNKGFAQLIKELKIPLYKLPKLTIRVHQEIAKKISQIKMIAGLKPVLEQLSSRGYKLGILSSNSLDNIKNFLKINQLDSLFDFVYADKHILGKDKVLKKMLKKEGLTTKQVLYFGDEVRDIEACHKVAIAIVAVTWGFNSKQILLANQPNFLVEKPAEILEIL